MGQLSVDSGIKVLDRAVAIITAASTGSRTLSALCEATGLPRATVHRLATALEVHNILARTDDGQWQLGTFLASFPTALIEHAEPIMEKLVTATGESTQLYQRTGNTRTCVAAIEPKTGLHNTVAVGSELPLNQGSGAKIIAAYDAHADSALSFDATELTHVRAQGLAESIAEREVGLASLSAPILGSQSQLVAVISISGPVERLKPSPIERWGDTLLAAAKDLSRQLTG